MDEIIDANVENIRVINFPGNPGKLTPHCAHVIQRREGYLLAFSKMVVDFIPPEMFVGSTRVELFRKGCECRTLGVWNPRKNGIVPGELELGDRIDIYYRLPDEFYQTLFAQARLNRISIESMDSALRTMLQ